MLLADPEPRVGASLGHEGEELNRSSFVEAKLLVSIEFFVLTVLEGVHRSIDVFVHQSQVVRLPLLQDLVLRVLRVLLVLIQDREDTVHIRSGQGGVVRLFLVEQAVREHVGLGGFTLVVLRRGFLWFSVGAGLN